MKKLRFLYWLIFAFFVGFISTIFTYQGLWMKWGSALKTVPIYMYFLWFIITFYLALTMHELGHLMSFVFQGVKIRALYITIFIFYRSKKGLRFRINPKLWVLLGGLVVPDLGVIDSDEAFSSMIKKFSKALITAPIVTIVFWVMMIVLCITLLLTSSNLNLLGMITVISMYLTLITIVFVHSFRLSNPMFYGDFVAYKKIKEDPIFQTAQLGQYTIFSLHESKETNDYFFHQATSLLRKTSVKRHVSYMGLLQLYLEGVIYHDQPFDHQVDIKIQRFPVNQYLYQEQGILLLHEICLYHYKLNRPDKAYQLYEMTKERAGKKINPVLLNYLNQRVEHVLHIEDHASTLTEGKKYLTGQMWIFDSLIDLDELLSHMIEKLPFVTYETKVYLESNEKNKGE